MPYARFTQCRMWIRRATQLPLDGFGRIRRALPPNFTGTPGHANVAARPEPYPPPGRLMVKGATSGASRDLRAGSNQQEIDQRDQGSPNAGSDQHIVSAEAAARIERRLVRFLRHFGFLGPAGPTSCEAGHIRWISLSLGSPGTGLRAPELVSAGTGQNSRQESYDGSASQGLAIRRRRTALAVDADRRHGEGGPPGSPRHALRSQGIFGIAPATGAPCVAVPVLARLARVPIQPAELKTQPAKAEWQFPPANLSRNRLIQRPVSPDGC